MGKRLLASLGGLMLLVGGPLHAKTVRLVYTDAQGTVIAKTDVQGTILARYDYRPYGAPVSGGLPPGPGYTGHVNDPEAGLVYMQARYYDPVVGRFLSVDPMGLSSGSMSHFNRYVYALNSPLSFQDLDGMEAKGGKDMDICDGPVPCDEDINGGYDGGHKDAQRAGGRVPARTPRGMEKYFVGASTSERINAALAVMNYYKIDYTGLDVIYRNDLIDNADTFQIGQLYVGPHLFEKSFGYMGAILSHEVEGHWILQLKNAYKTVSWDNQSAWMREVQAFDVELSPRNIKRFGLTPSEIDAEMKKRNRYFNALTPGNQDMVRRGIYKQLGD